VSSDVPLTSLGWRWPRFLGRDALKARRDRGNAGRDRGDAIPRLSREGMIGYHSSPPRTLIFLPMNHGHHFRRIPIAGHGQIAEGRIRLLQLGFG
jgi:hypothetical protein